MTAILDLQTPAPGLADDLAGSAQHKTALHRQNAIHHAGNFGVLDLHLAFQHAALGDLQLGGVERRGLDGAFDNQPFGVRNGALHADATADHQGPPLA